MSTRHVKDLEELVDLQAKAIEALQQAAGALRIALEVIQKEIVFLPGAPLPTVPIPQYPPNPIPWSSGGLPTTGTAVWTDYCQYAQNAQTALQSVSANLAQYSAVIEGTKC